MSIGQLPGCAPDFLRTVSDKNSGADGFCSSCSEIRLFQIKSVVQGEPLNNYVAVRGAVSMLTDGRFFGLKRQKVTVSTVGVVPRIRQVGLVIHHLLISNVVRIRLQFCKNSMHVLPAMRLLGLSNCLCHLSTCLVSAEGPVFEPSTISQSWTSPSRTSLSFLPICLCIATSWKECVGCVSTTKCATVVLEHKSVLRCPPTPALLSVIEISKGRPIGSDYTSQDWDWHHPLQTESLDSVSANFDHWEYMPRRWASLFQRHYFAHHSGTNNVTGSAYFASSVYELQPFTQVSLTS